MFLLVASLHVLTENTKRTLFLHCKVPEISTEFLNIEVILVEWTLLILIKTNI